MPDDLNLVSKIFGKKWCELTLELLREPNEPNRKARNLAKPPNFPGQVSGKALN
jgi:hypothetical protein